MHMTTCLLENEPDQTPNEKLLWKNSCRTLIYWEYTSIPVIVAAQDRSRVNPLFSKQIVLPLLLPLFLLFILPYFLKRVINGLKKENSTLCGIIKNVVQAGCISSRLGTNLVRCSVGIKTKIWKLVKILLALIIFFTKWLLIMTLYSNFDFT